MSKIGYSANLESRFMAELEGVGYCNLVRLWGLCGYRCSSNFIRIKQRIKKWHPKNHRNFGTP